jgi:hypothetical protein
MARVQYWGIPMIFEDIGPLKPADIITVSRQQAQLLIIRGDFEGLDKTSTPAAPPAAPVADPAPTPTPTPSVPAAVRKAQADIEAANKELADAKTALNGPPNVTIAVPAPSPAPPVQSA